MITCRVVVYAGLFLDRSPAHRADASLPGKESLELVPAQAVVLPYLVAPLTPRSALAIMAIIIVCRSLAFIADRLFAVIMLSGTAPCPRNSELAHALILIDAQCIFLINPAHFRY